jgi:hypothetical protein
MLNVRQSGTLFATKLLVQTWHIVIPLRLVEVASNWIAKVVFSSEFGNMLLASSVTRTIRQSGFVEVQVAALLKQQEDVTMQLYKIRSQQTDDHNSTRESKASSFQSTTIVVYVFTCNAVNTGGYSRSTV